MKNFKKFLSAALSVALIAVTAVGGIGATAETSENEGSESTAIKATPLTFEYENANLSENVWRNYNFVATPSFVTPLGYTTAKGLTAVQNDNYRDTQPHESTYVRDHGRYVAFYTNGILGKSDGIIFYVKTDKANAIVPVLSADESVVKFDNKSIYEISGKVGSEYQYAKIGDNVWTTANFGTGKNGNNCSGLVTFDEAFEGYIKIPYTSLGNDTYTGYKFNPETDKIKQVLCYFKGLGTKGNYNATETSDTDYGSAVFGPVMLMTEDSTSTKIEVPDSWKTASVKLKDIGGYASFQKNNQNWNIKYEKTTITSGVLKGEGVTIDSDTEYVYDASDTTTHTKNLNYAPAVVTKYAAAQDLSGTSGFVFYVKVGKANKISPMFKVTPTFGWDGAYLWAGATYYTMPLNGISWSSATAGKGCDNESAHGTIALEEGFEGYVKIPYSSLANSKGDYNSTGKFTSADYDLNEIEWRAVNVGNGYSYTVGQVYLVKEDSSSPEMEIVYDPINATAITRYELKHWDNKNNNEENVEIDTLNLNGVKLTLKEGQDAQSVNKERMAITQGSMLFAQMYLKNANNETSENGKRYELPNAVKTNGALLIYVKTTGENSMHLGLKEQGNATYYENTLMKANAAYYTAGLNDTGWTEKSFTTKTITYENAESKTYSYLIEFDSAFEGYVKIPASSIDWKGITPATIGRIEVYFEGLGGDYGDEIIVSPLMYTEQDSPSVTVNVTKAYADGDVDRSGAIDSADLAACRKFLLGADVDANAGDADANYDGKADILDLIRIKKLCADKVS